MNESVDTHALEQKTENGHAEHLFHGLVVAAGTRDTLDILWSWGDAAVSPSLRPMEPDAIFDIASVTKVVATASACAICIDRGLLDPDAPASDYLPRIPSFGPAPIRVRDLATHASGLDNRKFDTEAPERLVEAAVEAPAQRPVGERFEYSCRNFILLGAIVEQVTGEPLAAFLHENLFKPLQMRDTRFGPIRENLQRVVPTIVPPGTTSDEQARRAASPIGNAGLFSTPSDLSRFCRAILQKADVFGEKGLDWLTQPCNENGLPRWSFGWDMRPYPDSPHRPSRLSESAIGHSGWTGQSVWIDPEQGRYLVILTNRTHAIPDIGANYEPCCRLRSELGDIVLEALR